MSHWILELPRFDESMDRVNHRNAFMLILNGIADRFSHSHTPHYCPQFNYHKQHVIVSSYALLITAI